MKLENLKSIRRLIYRNGNRVLRVIIDESTYHINIYLLIYIGCKIKKIFP